LDDRGKASFGNQGWILTDFGQSVDRARSVAVQQNGKIVVAGMTLGSSGISQDFALARYDVDGTLDAEFDGDGRLTSDFGSRDEAADVVIQPNGRLLVAGTSGSDFALARYVGDPVGDTNAIADEIADLIRQVADLGATDMLNEGQTAALIAILEATAERWSQDNHVAAIGQLQAFMNQVNAFIEAEILSPESAQPLIDAASWILEQLSSHELRSAEQVKEYGFAGVLSDVMVAEAFHQAVSYWSFPGTDVGRLASVDIRITDLPGDLDNREDESDEMANVELVAVPSVPSTVDQPQPISRPGEAQLLKEATDEALQLIDDELLDLLAGLDV
jgi:uncharacterized delta-60 repeat protein